MAQSVWKGYLTFGLISIPMRLFSAGRSERVSFNQLHKECHSRLRQPLFCPTCNRMVERMAHQGRRLGVVEGATVRFSDRGAGSGNDDGFAVGHSYLALKRLWSRMKHLKPVQPSHAICQPISANGWALAPTISASALLACPSWLRRQTPCRMAATRKRLNAR